MATFDRAAQFQLIHGLVDAAQKARIADDAATTAMDTEQATIDDLTRKVKLLESKILIPATATPSDYQNYGLTLGTLQTEQAKLPALQDTQSKTHTDWDAARRALFAAVGAIDQNPGQQERS